MALNRRQLIQQLAATGLLGATPLSAALAARRKRTMSWRNWSGAQICLPKMRAAPANEEELIALIGSTAGELRPVGSGHSFSALVPTDDTIVSLARLSGMIGHDSAAMTAQFWGGTPMSQMGVPLKGIGQALPNQADIDYQTLAGAIATSTHGTGINYGSYSTLIRSLRIITPQGEVLDVSGDQHPDIFSAARVSLGALGFVTRVELQNRPAFRLKERMWLARTEELLEDIETLKAENRHWEMQVITNSDYAASITLNETDEPRTPGIEEGPEGGNEYVYWIQQADKYGSDFPRARRALLNLVAKTAGFEDRVGDSFEIFANVRDVRFNEMEYSVPAEAGPACLREILKAIDERNLPTWFPIEYRYVKADDIPLSMFQGRDSCSISIHQHHSMSYHEYFSAVEKIFWKYEGRPHWGKLHTLNAAQLSRLYPHWQQFADVRQRLDPNGRMLNAHLRSVFGVSAVG